LVRTIDGRIDKKLIETLLKDKREGAWMSTTINCVYVCATVDCINKWIITLIYTK
jgi:hypothetical protein